MEIKHFHLLPPISEYLFLNTSFWILLYFHQSKYFGRIKTICLKIQNFWSWLVRLYKVSWRFSAVSIIRKLRLIYETKGLVGWKITKVSDEENAEEFDWENLKICSFQTPTNVFWGLCTKLCLKGHFLHEKAAEADVGWGVIPWNHAPPLLSALK